MNKLKWSTSSVEDLDDTTVTVYEANFVVMSQESTLIDIEFEIVEIKYTKSEDFSIHAVYSSAADRYVETCRTLKDECESVEEAMNICQCWLNTALQDLTKVLS